MTPEDPKTEEATPEAAVEAAEPVADPVATETPEELAARGVTPTGSLLNPPHDPRLS